MRRASDVRHPSICPDCQTFTRYNAPRTQFTVPEASMELDDQVALLMQGTEYGDESIKAHMAAELRLRLAEGRPLRVYCGYDPTSTDLHLGHTISMRKLRQFQDLGHDVTFLIGSYTALVGDPSDKNK